MDLRWKNILYTVVLLAAMYAVFLYRKNQAPEPMRIEGYTMGTTYHITYFDKHGRNFKSEVDSLLRVVNQSINDYDSTSEVSRFNRSTRGVAVQLPYFLPSLQVSKEIYRLSDGAFDPTVGPLINFWGFGPGRSETPDTSKVRAIKQYIGFDKVNLSDDSVTKTDPRVRLSFGGIGQGYGADVITAFLRDMGIGNMLVELGGEGMAVGINVKTGKPWQIGILDPNSTKENQFFKAYVSLQDRSFTTSGNYFNYRVVDGVKYSHTIDPATGFPARKAILSASVFSKDCTRADAWGTALMVMGHEKAIEFLKHYKDIDVLLMYSTEEGKVETFMTEGIRPFITIENHQEEKS
jgi:FAD:protein FMN transferase